MSIFCKSASSLFGTQYHTTNLNGYNPKQKAGDDNSGASDENGKNKHSRATVPNFMMSFAVHHAMVRLSVHLLSLLK